MLQSMATGLEMAGRTERKLSLVSRCGDHCQGGMEEEGEGVWGGEVVCKGFLMFVRWRSSYDNLLF